MLGRKYVTALPALAIVVGTASHWPASSNATLRSMPHNYTACLGNPLAYSFDGSLSRLVVRAAGRDDVIRVVCAAATWKIESSRDGVLKSDLTVDQGDDVGISGLLQSPPGTTWVLVRAQLGAQTQKFSIYTVHADGSISEIKFPRSRSYGYLVIGGTADFGYYFQCAIQSHGLSVEQSYAYYGSSPPEKYAFTVQNTYFDVGSRSIKYFRDTTSHSFVNPPIGGIGIGCRIHR